MTRLHIKIKDNEKANILLNLLKELPFVEIEESVDEKTEKSGKGDKGNVADLFGLWENRNITLRDIRKKAWARN
ncbi:MAG: hypothetical protein PVF32_26550 [Desulfobacterales bacterium]|jgi:hypothetical protein